MSCSLEYGHLSVAAVVMTMVAKVGFAHDSTASELFLLAQGKLMPPILMPKTYRYLADNAHSHHQHQLLASAFQQHPSLTVATLTLSRIVSRPSFKSRITVLAPLR
jgi:hypothetical protein